MVRSKTDIGCRDRFNVEGRLIAERLLIAHRLVDIRLLQRSVDPTLFTEKLIEDILIALIHTFRERNCHLVRLNDVFDQLQCDSVDQERCTEIGVDAGEHGVIFDPDQLTRLQVRRTEILVADGARTSSLGISLIPDLLLANAHSQCLRGDTTIADDFLKGYVVKFSHEWTVGHNLNERIDKRSGHGDDGTTGRWRLEAHQGNSGTEHRRRPGTDEYVVLVSRTIIKESVDTKNSNLTLIDTIDRHGDT